MRVRHWLTALAAAPTRARPAHAGAFRANLAALEGALNRLGAQLAGAAAALGDAPLILSHPVYAYLERRYGPNGRSLHWEPDESPSAAAWRDLEALLAVHPASWIIWVASPLRETAQRIEVVGLGSIVYAPAGRRSALGSWRSAMPANAAQLAALAEG